MERVNQAGIDENRWSPIDRVCTRDRKVASTRDFFETVAGTIGRSGNIGVMRRIVFFGGTGSGRPAHLGLQSLLDIGLRWLNVPLPASRVFGPVLKICVELLFRADGGRPRSRRILKPSDALFARVRLPWLFRGRDRRLNCLPPLGGVGIDVQSRRERRQTPECSQNASLVDRRAIGAWISCGITTTMAFQIAGKQSHRSVNLGVLIRTL
jgi:hypothetical protein